MSETRATIVKEFVITDSNAVEHKAVLVGVLDTFKYQQPNQTTSINTVQGKTVQVITRWSENKALKELSVGLSITNPIDVYDVKKGILIAEGRALRTNKQIMLISSESRGALGKEMIDVILAQQVDFIQKNQGLFLKVGKPSVK